MFRKIGHVLTSLALLSGALFWSGCTDKERDTAAVSASLPALPQEEIAKLKPVPNRQMLATSEVKMAPNAAPAEGFVHPNCAADDIETDYSAEVLYAVTVCTPIIVVSGGTGVFSPGEMGPVQPTHKVDFSALSAEQQGAFTDPKGSNGTIYWCKQKKGPWQGHLSSEHACIGLCSTQNTLTLTNTPNLVTFQWVGSVQDHPTAFEYQGKLTSLGTVDWGRCHPDNARPHAASHKGN